MSYAKRPLEVGQKIRLDHPEGAVWEVIRVTQGSATIKRKGERVRVEISEVVEMGEVVRKGKKFEAWEGGGTLTISVGSFVWPEVPPAWAPTCGDPACRGWCHWDDPWGIERCDECQRFPDDDLAIEAHDRECREGAGCEYRQEREGEV